MADATPDSSETRNLLQQVRAGDRQAFEELFTRHLAEVRQFVEARMDAKVRARLDPSDIVQETQMEVFRRLGDYLDRQPMPFRIWLRKTAYERLLMARRQHLDAQQRAVCREAPRANRSSQLLANRLVSPGTTPSQKLQRAELVRRVRRALEQMADADREILLMRNFDELSYEEVGFILEIEPAAARKRHGRALLRLHKLLAETGFRRSEL
jgi:RNA polymerase sigma-70 factor (ECF subfamily)